MIMDGEVDEYPEAAFNLVGTIEDAIEKGKKMMAAGAGTNFLDSFDGTKR